jgi:hypothetical protein
VKASHGLDGILGEIADVAGIAAALALAEQYGGTQVHFPRVAGPDHWLVLCVGDEAAKAICAYMTVTDADGHRKGQRGVLIPRGPMALMRQAKRRLVRELQAGTSAREAARRAGLGERTAWYTKAKLKDGRQDDLF